MRSCMVGVAGGIAAMLSTSRTRKSAISDSRVFLVSARAKDACRAKLIETGPCCGAGSVSALSRVGTSFLPAMGVAGMLSV